MGKNATQAGSIDTAGYKLTSEIYLNITKDQAQDGFKWITPMEMFDAFSRIKMVLLETGKEKNSCVEFNIKPQAMSLIMKKLDFCVDAMMLNKHNSARQQVDQSQAPAETPIFNMGVLKGKTPYQVLTEMGQDTLIKQRAFLMQNIQKYPQNGPLVTEIDRVLAGGAGQEAEHYLIYEEKFKIPNAKKLDKQGKTRAYGVTISCFPANRNTPFKVSAFECRCTPKVDEKGMTCAAKGSVSDRKMLTADFDEKSFYEFMSALQQRVDGFVYAFTAWAIKTANEMYETERKKALEAKKTTQPSYPTQVPAYVQPQAMGQIPATPAQMSQSQMSYGYPGYPRY